ncbi:MAG: O-antigen ligase family protein [Candidatus Eisenbacteria bacterium]|nr:O-antigen ligase family protein [Candidatus Eisenbacteria bacterium]
MKPSTAPTPPQPRLPVRHHPGSGRWWTKIIPVAALLGAAYYIGLLIQRPERRVIQSAAGALLLYLAFRLSIYQSLAFFLVVYPYPTFTSVGSTNTLILFVIAVVWAVRVTTGELKMTFRGLLTPVFPLIILGYLLSTYSIQTEEHLQGSIGILFDVLSCLMLYFMVVNFVTDERSLRRTLYFFGISSILIHFVAVYEVLFPGRAFLPGWLISERTTFLNARFGVRTGGPFRDFELLSEYCAVTIPLVLFLWLRSPRGGRMFWGVVLGLTVFSQFATVTRGGFVSLILGLAYLAWMLRKELGVVKTVTGFATVLVLLAGIGVVLPSMFRMESLFERLERTKLEKGLPDSRAFTWTQSWKRAQEHIFLGHGPQFTSGSGLTRYYWPHNGYLFLWVTIGLTGLVGYVAAFLTCFFATGRYRGPYMSGDFVPGLLTALHVSWLVFMVDQAKIDFGRNPIYFQFTWLLMGLTSAVWAIARHDARAREAAGIPAGVPGVAGSAALAGAAGVPGAAGVAGAAPGAEPVPGAGLPAPGPGRTRKIMGPA